MMAKKVTEHTTRDGRKIKLCDMSDEHLANTIQLIERRAKEGIIIRIGGGVDLTDLWYDEYTLYGQEVLGALGHGSYIAEQRRRQKGGA